MFLRPAILQISFVIFIATLFPVSFWFWIIARCGSAAGYLVSAGYCRSAFGDGIHCHRRFCGGAESENDTSIL